MGNFVKSFSKIERNKMICSAVGHCFRGVIDHIKQLSGSGETFTKTMLVFGNKVIIVDVSPHRTHYNMFNDLRNN